MFLVDLEYINFLFFYSGVFFKRKFRRICLKDKYLGYKVNMKEKKVKFYILINSVSFLYNSERKRLY